MLSKKHFIRIAKYLKCNCMQEQLISQDNTCFLNCIFSTKQPVSSITFHTFKISSPQLFKLIISPFIIAKIHHYWMINVQTFQISLHTHPYGNYTILQWERLRQTINRHFFIRMNSMAWECLRILSKLLEAIKEMTQITFKVSYEHTAEANRKTQNPPKKPPKFSSVKSPEPGCTRWPSSTSCHICCQCHPVASDHHPWHAARKSGGVCLFVYSFNNCITFAMFANTDIPLNRTATSLGQWDSK